MENGMNRRNQARRKKSPNKEVISKYYNKNNKKYLYPCRNVVAGLYDAGADNGATSRWKHNNDYEPVTATPVEAECVSEGVCPTKGNSKQRNPEGKRSKKRTVPKLTPRSLNCRRGNGGTEAKTRGKEKTPIKVTATKKRKDFTFLTGLKAKTHSSYTKKTKNYKFDKEGPACMHKASNKLANNLLSGISPRNIDFGRSHPVIKAVSASPHVQEPRTLAPRRSDKKKTIREQKSSLAEDI